jgi:DNA-directed RNA polymerase III subunit RPC11
MLSSRSGLLFCPTCANLLLIKSGFNESMMFWCRTCPYTYPIKDEILKITESFDRKPIDDVLGGDDAWKDVERTQARCPSNSCNSNLAYFRQMQIRSADEPTTTFYRCVSCCRQWRED